MSEIVIKFENVTKSYPQYSHLGGGFKHVLLNFPGSLRKFNKERFLALKNININIKKGESLGIVGRNGAGKSTTLGMMAGVLHPNLGKVSVKGRVSSFLELGAGFHPDLTGRENILLNGVLMGMTRKEVRKKIEEIIEFADLGDFIEQPIRIYSSGMKTRLGFSVIAHLDPEILLIDEVLAVGDQQFKEKSRAKMMDFRKSGITMVFVSHSAQSVVNICDRAIWIENHVIKMEGPTGEIMEAYTGKPVEI